MKVNKQAFALFGVTEKQYRQWCRDNKKAINSAESRGEFFHKIHTGKLIKDKNGNIIVKRRRSSEKA